MAEIKKKLKKTNTFTDVQEKKMKMNLKALHLGKDLVLVDFAVLAVREIEGHCISH